ncbi:MAG: CoF synthetase, partial [Leifsonia sp.]
GRSDLSVDYNGAVVAPDALRDVIYGDTGLLQAVENHRLISYEDDNGDRQLHIALQLTEAATIRGTLDQDGSREHVLRELRRMNGDFNNAILTAPEGTLPTVAFYGFRQGPFARDGAKLKNEYVWQLAAGELADWSVDLAHTAAR